MQSARDIKNRIKSISNTKQIAKAMEVVSATKMKRSQEVVIASRPFTRSIFNLIADIPSDFIAEHELVKAKKINRETLIVITSDKGLAGVYNSNILKNADKYIRDVSQSHPIDVIAVGKKAKEHYSKRQANIIKEYQLVGDYVREDQSRKISQHVLDSYLSQSTDKVSVIYTNFISTLKQDVSTTQILPIDQQNLKFRLKANYDYKPYERKFEPDTSTLLNLALTYIFHLSVFDTIIESNASEHSARMLAMKKASDNASEIISDLTLEYNKSRQAGITQELIEIISGAEIA